MPEPRLKPLLSESEKYLRLIYDNLTDAVFLLRLEADGKLRCISFNKSALLIFGFDSNLMLGRLVDEILGSRATEKLKQRVDIAVESQGPQRFETTLETRKGKKTLDIVLAPFLDEKGVCSHVLGTACDITPRIVADAKARAMAQRQQALLDSIHDFAWMKDRDGRFVAVNDSLARAVGTTPEEMVGKVGSDYWSMEYEKAFLENDAVVMRLGEPMRCVETFYDERGNKISRDSIKVPTFDEHGDVSGTAGTSRDTSELQKAFLALQESERRLAEAEKIAKIGHFEWDFKTGLIERSPGQHEIFGFGPDEFKGGQEVFFSLVHPEDRERVRESWTRSVERGVPWEVEYRIILRDGQMRHVRTEATVAKDSAGNPVRMLGMSQDITRQKETISALQQSENRLAEAEKIAGIGHWEWNIESGRVERSVGALEIFGLKPGEIKDDPELFFTLVHPEDRERVRVIRDRCAESGASAEYEFRVIRPDGKIRYVQTLIRVSKGADGKPARMLGINHDITVQRKIISDLQENEKRLAEAERIGRVAHSSWDFKTGYVERSPVLYDILGVVAGAEHAGPDGLERYIHPDDLEWYRACRRLCVEEGGRYDITFRVIRPDGTIRYLHQDAQAYYGPDGKPERLIAMCRDVTERHEFERDLKQSREDLKRLSGELLKLQEEERKKIAQEIHDEFGQALTALKIDLFWIISRLRKDQQDILEKAEAMSVLIGSSFQAMRRAITELRPTLLDEVGLAEAMKWKLDEFGKRLAFESRLIVRPENLKVDPSIAAPLFRIFQECLTNIARHSGATRVLVSLERKKKVFRMRVSDNGRGFNVAARDKLTHGLIGMRERAGLIGGRLEIRSEPGKGVTVEVILRME